MWGKDFILFCSLIQFRCYSKFSYKFPILISITVNHRCFIVSIYFELWIRPYNRDQTRSNVIFYGLQINFRFYQINQGIIVLKCISGKALALSKRVNSSTIMGQVALSSLAACIIILSKVAGLKTKCCIKKDVIPKTTIPTTVPNK